MADKDIPSHCPADPHQGVYSRWSSFLQLPSSPGTNALRGSWLTLNHIRRHAVPSPTGNNPLDCRNGDGSQTQPEASGLCTGLTTRRLPSSTRELKRVPCPKQPPWPPWSKLT